MAQEVTNFARFYGILKKSYKFATKELGDEFKEGVVSQFTDGRTTSLRDMTRKEYDMMCDKLEGVTAKLIRTAKDEQRKHRSKCFSFMQKTDIVTTDCTRNNAFCQDQRIAGKVFSQLSNEELEQLSVKLRSIQQPAAPAHQGGPLLEELQGLLQSHVSPFHCPDDLLQTCHGLLKGFVLRIHRASSFLSITVADSFPSLSRTLMRSPSSTCRTERSTSPASVCAME